MKLTAHIALLASACLAATSLGLIAAGGSALGTPAAAPASSGFDPKDFETPRSDSMPAIYWYWGGVITDDIIGTQMAEMREKGIDEFVLFPFNGADMEPDFATEAWFDRVEFTIREAARTGHAGLDLQRRQLPVRSRRQASSSTAASSVTGRVPARPDLRLKGLWRSTAVVDGDTTDPTRPLQWSRHRRRPARRRRPGARRRRAAEGRRPVDRLHGRRQRRPLHRDRGRDHGARIGRRPQRVRRRRRRARHPHRDAARRRRRRPASPPAPRSPGSPTSVRARSRVQVTRLARSPRCSTASPRRPPRSPTRRTRTARLRRTTPAPTGPCGAT